MTRCLLDTNVLLRLLGPESEQRKQSLLAVTVLRSRGGILCVTPQVLIEFWCVATRPVAQNGFGWSAVDAGAQIDHILRQFPVVDDCPAVFAIWLDLVRSLDVRGKRVHDIRLAAVMQAHDIPNLLTFNPSDFDSCPGISVLVPGAVR